MYTSFKSKPTELRQWRWYHAPYVMCELQNQYVEIFSNCTAAVNNMNVLPQTNFFLHEQPKPCIRKASPLCHHVRCMRWGHLCLFHTATSLFKLIQNDLHGKYITQTHLGEIYEHALYVCAIYYLGHRHFHWRIIAVLTQNPTVLMFVDITSALKL